MKTQEDIILRFESIINSLSFHEKIMDIIFSEHFKSDDIFLKSGVKISKLSLKIGIGGNIEALKTLKKVLKEADISDIDING